MNAQKPSMGRSPLFFYGWVVVGVSFVTLAVGYGLRSCFSVFLVAIVEEFGWGRGAISGAFALHMLVASVGLPLAGALVDRYGPRLLLPFGTLIMAAGMWSLGSLHEIWQLYLFYGLVMASGRVMISMTPHTAILSKWFVKKRGTALGIATSGIGIGAVLLVPLVEMALSRYGWHQGCFLIAVLVFLVVCPLNFFFQRMKPEEMGLAPDGKGGEPENASSGLGAPDSHRETAIEAQWTLRKALRSPAYWALYFAFFFGGTFMIVDTHQIASLVDKGVDKATASLVFAGAGLMHTVGVLVGGVASDRIGSRRSFAIGAASLIVGIVFLLHIQEPSQTLSLFVFILLYGFGKGFRTALMPLIAAEVFHGERVGTIYGSLATAISFGGVAGPWLAGILHDRTGDYGIAFGVVIISTAVSSVLVWMAPPPRGLSAAK